MVRAAVSGAVDYSRADPLDNHWRIKHRLLITETQRREEQRALEYAHQHWCAYVAHGRLEENSFKTAKDTAADILHELQNLIFPWERDKAPKAENAPQNSKMDPATQKLIDQYRAMVAEHERRKQAEQ
jgi:hypothetical protein